MLCAIGKNLYKHAKNQTISGNFTEFMAKKLPRGHPTYTKTCKPKPSIRGVL